MPGRVVPAFVFVKRILTFVQTKRRMLGMTNRKKPAEVSDAQIRMVAAFARCALPTAAKFLRGEPVRGKELCDRLKAAKDRAEAVANLEPGSAGVR